MDDSTLIQAVWQGHSEAFGALVERYQERVLRLCYYVTGNSTDAEDLAHEAFIEAYVKLRQLRDPQKFAPWLKRIALNLCRMWYRRNRLDTVAWLQEPCAEADESQDALYQRMFQGLTQLSAPHRLALILHYWEGLSYEEVAQFLGVPVGTVMSRLYRARRELKQRMARLDPDEERTMNPDETFKQEVEAEIATLVTMFRDDPTAMERLSVILRRSPERFAQLIRQAPEQSALEDLARLLRRLGPQALEVALECYLSVDPRLHANADTLLTCFVARGKPGTEGIPATRMAWRGAYLLLDQLIRLPADADVKAWLLAGWMEAGPDEPSTLLYMNLMLCYSEAAIPLLLERFWSAATPGDLYRSDTVLQALCRTGTRFAQALLAPLEAGDLPRQALALAGAEALARTLHCDWLDLDSASDAQVALDARFRRRWAPPLRQDRDPALLQALAARLAALLEDDRGEVRSTALRALLWLKARDWLPQILDCVRHAEPRTRQAALRALADIGGPDAIALLMEVARTGTVAEKKLALMALGHMQAEEARVLLAEKAEDPDVEIRRAAAFALGDLGSAEARAALERLAQSNDRAVQAAVARGRHIALKLAESLNQKGPSGRPQQMAERVRGGERPPFFISLEAAIRSIPALQTYDEIAFSRLIGQACYDFASARRYLVEEGLIRRPGGVYEFTEAGKAVWRVEHFIRERYRATEPPPGPA